MVTTRETRRSLEGLDEFELVDVDQLPARRRQAASASGRTPGLEHS